MKNYGAKIFRERGKLRKLLRLAKTNRYSAPQLAKIFKCNKKPIHGALNRAGIYLPNLGRFKRRYKCDDEFFIKLIPTSAYWLGFIAADGCLYLGKRGEKNFYIALNCLDVKHLKNFKKTIKTNAKIGYIKSNNSTHISFYSVDKIFDSLVKLGIKPNKRLRIENVIVPNNLMSHFIRGVFDGDGSLSGKKITHVQFQIAGYKPLLKQVQDILIKKCNVNKVKIYPLGYKIEGQASRLQYTGSQIFRILDFLYKESTNRTRLERKYKKYLMFKKKFGK